MLGGDDVGGEGCGSGSSNELHSSRYYPFIPGATKLVGHRVFPVVIWAMGPVIRKLMCTIMCSVPVLRRTRPQMIPLLVLETMFRLKTRQAMLRCMLIMNPA